MNAKVKKLNNRILLQELLKKHDCEKVEQSTRDRLLILNDEFQCVRCGGTCPNGSKAAGYAVNLCPACATGCTPHEGGHLVFEKHDRERDISYICVKCGNAEVISTASLSAICCTRNHVRNGEKRT